MCVLCVLSGGGPGIVRTTDSGRLALVSLSNAQTTDSGSPYRRLTQEYLEFMFDLVPDTGPGRGMRCDAAPYSRSVNSRDAAEHACRAITGAD